MICHVVLIRLKPEISHTEAKAFMETAEKTLGPIPVVQNLKVAEGLGLRAEVSYPIALVMDFEDEAALEAYQVHPEHQRFVSEIVGPIQDDKKVFDYRY